MDKKTTRHNRIMDIIEDYGDMIDLDQDLNMVEAMDIIRASHTRLEIAENSYLYGHRIGSAHARRVPVYALRQMTDEEWNQKAYLNRIEREVVS